MHRRQVDALHVDRIDAVELGFGHFQVGLVAVRPARVVDHDVERAAGCRDELRPVLAARHVGVHELSLHLARDLRAGRVVDVGDDHVGAFFAEAPRDAGAEPGCGAGDDGCLSLQSHFSSSGCLNGLCSRSSST